MNKDVSKLNFVGKLKSNKAQEEMIGFAMIMVIVIIVILFFLVFSLRNNSTENVQSYEVDNFIQAMLQYTTSCDNYLGNYSLQYLMFQCANGNTCLNEKESCEVLNSTMQGILDESWTVGEENPLKGYDFDILANGQGLISVRQGNQTSNYKGALQDLTKGPYSISISLQVYS